MINFQNFNSLYSVTSYFNNEHICKQVIAKSQWADGDIICPYCGNHHCITRKEEYVCDGVNTNAMEGFWSHFRRMIMGCYHDVSDKYIQRYINEAVYRWNTRNMDESQRFAHMFNKSIGKCNYLQVKISA